MSSVSKLTSGREDTAVAFLGLLDAGNKKKNVAQDSQIVVTSSVAGYSRYLASSFAYSTSKAAVNHAEKMLSTFMAQQKYRIRCNLIAPGVRSKAESSCRMETNTYKSSIRRR